MAIFILITISITSALVWHHYLRRYLLASIGASLTAAAAFEIAAYVQLGHLDPFFLIAATIATMAAFFIALAIGWTIRFFRK